MERVTNTHKKRILKVIYQVLGKKTQKKKKVDSKRIKNAPSRNQIDLRKQGLIGWTWKKKKSA